MKITLEYIHKNNWHEKYILNQLTKSEKADYENFIEQNDRARKELEQEKELIAGIRAAGSHELKKEIQRQAAELRNPRTDWTFIYKAAAVLLVLVLLPSIIYYQNYRTADQLAEPAMISDESYADENESKTVAPKEKSAEEQDLEITRNEKKKEKIEETAIKKTAADAIKTDANKREQIRQLADDKAPAPADMAEMEMPETSAFESRSMSRQMLGGAGKSALSPAAPEKVFEFNVQEKPVRIILFNKMVTESVPDSIKITVSKSDIVTDIRINVPRVLFAANKQDISLKLQNDSLIMAFFNKYNYLFKNDSTATVAEKIK